MQTVINGLKRMVGIEPASAESLTRVKSWMDIFQADVRVVSASTVEELAQAVCAGKYFCIGASHSYNGVQIVRDATALVMKGSGLESLEFNADTKEVTVGPAVTILQLKEFLIKHDRRLLNSGNFMAQTVIGALVTGTHGYGERAVMAESITALKFLDGQGEVMCLAKGDPDFEYAALSFGVIAPIVSLTLETAPLVCCEAKSIICRMSQKESHVTPQHAVMYGVFPYTDLDNPTIALQTILPEAAPGKATKSVAPLFTLRAISAFIIHRYWVFDRIFPAFRVPFQRFVARLNLHYEKVYFTDPKDLDYLYDPASGLESGRAPNIVKGFFSPTFTSYNLAFFVPLADAPEVLRFIMQQADQFRRLGFYLKTMIGVRELSTRSELPFAANFQGPVAGIDLFADVRDYAWLERIQREVFAYFPGVRPHWGKSAIVEEFAESLGQNHLDALKAFHHSQYGPGQLRTTNRVRRLFGIPVQPPQ